MNLSIFGSIITIDLSAKFLSPHIVKYLVGKHVVNMESHLLAYLLTYLATE